MLNVSKPPKSHADLGVATIDRVANYLIKCSQVQADALVNVSNKDWVLSLELEHFSRSQGLTHFSMFTDAELTLVEELVRDAKYGRLLKGCYALRSFASPSLERVTDEI